MLRIEQRNIDGYEQVVIGRDDATGLHAIISVHSTACGPSLGGIRMTPYADEDAALNDVLRLSHAMSRKNALADLALGGGKAVILGDPSRDKSLDLMRSMGQLIDSLDGAYLAAEDAGICPADIDVIAEVTEHVTGTTGGSGAPGLSTAPGVFIGIERACFDLLGMTHPPISGLVVAVQGLGSVGWMLCELLHERSAELIVTDINSELCDRAASEFGATVVAPDEIHRVACCVFAPCALGGVLTERTIGELRCNVVAGGANNQFADQLHGPKALLARGIDHAPDFVINAGGVIRIFILDILKQTQVELDTALAHIGEQLAEIWHRSREDNRPPLLVADELADARIAAGRP